MQRQQFASELQILALGIGEEVETSGSFEGAFRRGWMNLITSGDEHTILVECERDEDADFTHEGEGFGKGGTGVLSVDGKDVATKKMPHTIPFLVSMDESFDVGIDTRYGVDDTDYQGPLPVHRKAQQADDHAEAEANGGGRGRAAIEEALNGAVVNSDMSLVSETSTPRATRREARSRRRQSARTGAAKDRVTCARRAPCR